MTDDSPPTFDDPDVLDALDDRRSTRLNRREFLAYLGASLASSACGPGDSFQPASPDGTTTAGGDTGVADLGHPDTGRSDSGGDREMEDSGGADEDTRTFDYSDIDAYPFVLGVASGDPTPEGVILWTRLLAEPVLSGRMPDRPIPVTWEVAASRPPEDGLVNASFDEQAIVASGVAMAEPKWGHSLHIDVTGLEADAWYTYRFRMGEAWTSRIGQTRTLPAPHSRPDSFRIATACCQSYPEGYFRPLHHLAREPGLDAVFFLGDYIYEKTAGTIMREHPDAGLPATLEEFRRRYAVYKAEPELRDAHAHCPWMLTWDDHEVRNNYADLEEPTDALSTREFKKLRAAAYQAYYEHLPLRVPRKPDGEHLQIYRNLKVGKLVDFNVLDGRQYRSDLTCSGKVERRCEEATDEDRSMLGKEQRDWLIHQLRSSSTTWQAIVQQTIFTPINFNNLVINSDQWDGYQAERQQIIDVMAEGNVPNPIVITGDVHMGLLLEVPRDDDNPGDNPVAHEIVTTSVTSENTVGSWVNKLKRVAETLGQVRYFNATARGYTVQEYRPGEVRVHYRTVNTVHSKQSAVRTDISYKIERGSGDVTEI